MYNFLDCVRYMVYHGTSIIDFLKRPIPILRHINMKFWNIGQGEDSNSFQKRKRETTTGPI